MQSLFKRKKTKRKDNEFEKGITTPSQWQVEGSGSDREVSDNRTRNDTLQDLNSSASDRKKSTHRSMKSKLRHKMSSKPSLASQSPSSSTEHDAQRALGVVTSAMSMSSKISSGVSNFFDVAQSEKKLPSSALKPASKNIASFEAPTRVERTVRVPSHDVSVAFLLDVFVLSASSVGSAASRRVLPFDVLLAVDSVVVSGKTLDEVEDLFLAEQEVELRVSSLQELLWAIGGSSSETATIGHASSTVPRSELELLQERSYLDSRHVWLAHRDGIARALLADEEDGVLPTVDISKTESTRLVRVEDGNILCRVDDTDIDKVNPPSNDTSSNLIVLRQLNESAVLHTLRWRYRWGLVYTNAGQNLVCINPASSGCSLDVSTLGMDHLRHCQPSQLPPHPYAIASQARQRISQRRRDQTIVPLGISGSGKSYVAKQVLAFLSTTTPKAKGCQLNSQRVSDVLLLLQSFSSAANFIHCNASRLSTRFTLSFDANGCLIGGDLNTWLFEKSLVAANTPSSLNFNIFYQLWFGADRLLQKDLGFLGYPDKQNSLQNSFLPQLSSFTERQREEWKTQWLATCRALGSVGINKEERTGIWMLLAAIIHLGFSNFKARSQSITSMTSSSHANKPYFENRTSAAHAARLLGMDSDELLNSLTQQRASASMAMVCPWDATNFMAEKASASKSMTRTSTSCLSISVPDNFVACVDQFATAIYDKMLGSVILLLKRALEPRQQQHAEHSIHVLDMPGLRFLGLDAPHVMQRFSDICHNYAQERLQSVFHHSQFEKEIDAYLSEGVECNFASTVPGVYPIISAFDRYTVGDADRGIFPILEDELGVDNITDKNYGSALSKIDEFHSAASEISHAISFVCQNNNSFCIRHGEGHMPVEYHLSDWSKSMHDSSSIVKTVDWCMNNIKEGPIAALMWNPKMLTAAPIAAKSSLRSQTGRRAIAKRNVPSQIRLQMDSVVDILQAAKPTYIICIRPQSGCTTGFLNYGNPAVSTCRATPSPSVVSLQAAASHGSLTGGSRNSVGASSLPTMGLLADTNAQKLKSTLSHNLSLEREEPASLGTVTGAPAAATATSEDFDLHYVRLQVRKSQMICAMRVYRQGFPERISFADFIRSFQILSSRQYAAEEAVDDKIAAQDLLDALQVDSASYRLGCSKIFLKAGVLDGLRSMREKQLENTFIAFQARLRGREVRRQFQLAKVQDLAMRCIQKNVRKLVNVSAWPWWKLYTKVTPLLDVHRQDEELRGKDEAIASLQSRVDKLQKDSEDFKEAQQEIIRLQNRLHTLTGCYNEEQAAHEQANEVLEEEQMHRLHLEQQLAELQAEHTVIQKQNEQLSLQATEAMLHRHAFDDPEDEADSEGSPILNMRIRILTTEHRRALDSLRNELENERDVSSDAKRQTDKHMSSLRSELDEAYNQSSTMRKKMLRLESELADLMSHLEDEQSRNSVLERKQRRFDSELSSAVDELERVREMQSSLTSQKDSEANQRVTAEAMLRNVEEENTRLKANVSRLTEEGCMLSEEGGDNELFQLRKDKNLLAEKLEEQEEELEELASNLHILEQARTRLETGNQLLRHQHQKDIETRDEEREVTKMSFQRRIRALEAQLEDERSMRQKAVKAQRDTDSQMLRLRQQSAQGNPEVERRLRTHLRHTMALLEDAQVQIQAQQKRAAEKSAVRNLETQLEELSVALSQAKRAKACLDNELEESQSTCDNLNRSITELEGRLLAKSKTVIELETRLEDSEEDLLAMTTKLKAGSERVSVLVGETETLRCQLDEANLAVSHSKKQNTLLSDELSSLEGLCSSRAALQGQNTAKIRVLEDQIASNAVLQRRQDSAISRLKEHLEELSKQPERTAYLDTNQSSGKDKQLRERILNLEKQDSDNKKRMREVELKCSIADTELAMARRQNQQLQERIAKLQQALHVEDDEADLTEEDESASDMEDTPHATPEPRKNQRSSSTPAITISEQTSLRLMNGESRASGPLAPIEQDPSGAHDGGYSDDDDNASTDT